MSKKIPVLDIDYDGRGIKSPFGMKTKYEFVVVVHSYSSIAYELFIISQLFMRY